MALPTSYLSPADQAALARKVGVTLPDGRVYRDGRIISAQDAANAAGTRARDAAFAAQTGANPVRNGVNPNVAGQQAFDAYMGAVPGAPRRTSSAQPSIQTVPSTPIATPESAAIAAEQQARRTSSAQPSIQTVPSTPIATPESAAIAAEQQAQRSVVSTQVYSAPATAGFFTPGSPSFFEQPAMFKDGGYTGPGAPSKPAGIVHAGEFVIPADKVKEIGVRKLDAYFGTDSTKPKTEYQEGGYVAELMAYQSLFPNRNYSQDNLARIARMPGGEQILAAQVLEARRAVAERQQQEQVARAEATADSRQNRAEAQAAQSAVFLRTNRIPQADAEFAQADANVALAQEKVNEMLVPAASMAYDAAVAANEPWLFVETGGIDENGMPAMRRITKQEFAGEALRRTGPARAATEAQLKEGPNARPFIGVQRELATAQSQFKAAERALQSANQEYQRVAQFDPVNVAPAEAEALPAPAPMLRDGPTPEQRQADARAIQAAGDSALALGVNPGGTATNVTTPTGALPQGSIGFQSADGTYRVLLPGQKFEEAMSFANEASAAAYFQGAAEAQAQAAQSSTQAAANEAWAANAAGRARGGAEGYLTPTTPTAPAKSAPTSATLALAPADAALVSRSLPAASPAAVAPYFESAPQRPSFVSPEALGDVNRGRLINFFTSAGDVFRPRLNLPGADPESPDSQMVLPPEVLLERARRLPAGSPDRAALEARAASVSGALESELTRRQIRRIMPSAQPLPATAYFAGPQA